MIATKSATEIKEIPRLLMFAVCAFSGLVIGFEIYRNALFAIAGVAGVLVLLAIVRRPNVGTWLGIFAIYSNVGVALLKQDVKTLQTGLDQDSRSAVLALVALFLSGPLIYHIVVRRAKIVVDRGVVLMALFLIVLLISSVFARDKAIALTQVSDFALEGVALYLLVINLVRDAVTLRSVLCAVLFAGAAMGMLSIFQEATGTTTNNYYGLAQRGGVFEVPEAEENGDSGVESMRTRVAGPIGEQNRYAQILLVLLPLAFAFARWSRGWAARLFSWFTFFTILGGIILTFSRGACVALFAMLVAMTLLGGVKWYKVGIACLIGALVIVVAEPDYIVRLSSIGNVGGLFSRQQSTPDFSIRRRYAENVACIHTFMSSPLVGVGPGHFAAFYSEPYVNHSGIVRTMKGYRGHSLYLEMAAETGLLGILIFLSIVGSMLLQLRREYRSPALREHPEYVDLTKAFFVSIVGYMVSAIFLHLSYQRYFWLLLALASASVAVVRSLTGEDMPLYDDCHPNFLPAADVPLP